MKDLDIYFRFYLNCLLVSLIFKLIDLERLGNIASL